MRKEAKKEKGTKGRKEKVQEKPKEAKKSSRSRTPTVTQQEAASVSRQCES